MEDIGWSTDLLSPEHKEQAWGYNIGETRIEQQSEMDCHGGKILEGARKCSFWSFFGKTLASKLSVLPELVFSMPEAG